jgi:hypothetical protein
MRSRDQKDRQEPEEVTRQRILAHDRLAPRSYLPRRLLSPLGASVALASSISIRYSASPYAGAIVGGVIGTELQYVVATAAPTAPAAKIAARDKRPGEHSRRADIDACGRAAEGADRVASFDVTGAPGTRPELGTHDAPVRLHKRLARRASAARPFVGRLRDNDAAITNADRSPRQRQALGRGNRRRCDSRQPDRSPD